jgi:hypothetical protein
MTRLISRSVFAPHCRRLLVERAITANCEGEDASAFRGVRASSRQSHACRNNILQRNRLAAQAIALYSQA